MASPARDARLAHEAAGFTNHIERGAAHLISQNPTTQELARAMQVGEAGWHILGTDTEIDTAWQPSAVVPWQYEMTLADYNARAFREPTLSFAAGQLVQYIHPATGESVAFQPQTLQYSNDLSQLQTISDPQPVTAVIDDDELQWIGAYGSGLDFYWETQTAQLQKRLVINAFSDLPAPEQYIIDGGNPYLKLPFILARSANADIYVDGVYWEGKNKETFTTTGAVEFRHAVSGETLWYFRPPIAWDMNLEDEIGVQPSYYFRATNQDLFVEVRVPYAWLETAVYPLVIDPTINLQVGASADDGHAKQVAGSSYNNAALWALVGNLDPALYGMWARFTGVSGLSGATISTASFQLYGKFNANSPGVLQKVYAEDAAAPTAPTDAPDYRARTMTTASLDWDTDSVLNTWDSTDIASIIQELADSYDPSDISIFVKDDGSAAADYNFWSTYDDSTSTAAKLDIVYTVSTPGAIMTANKGFW